MHRIRPTPAKLVEILWRTHELLEFVCERLGRSRFE